MGVLDGARALAQLAKEVNRLDLYQQAVDLMAQVTELAQENFEAKQQIVSLREKVRELEDKLRFKGRMVFRDGVYYVATESGTDDGPYCTRCWEAEHLLIHLDSGDHWYCCPQCDTSFHKQEPPVKS